MTKLIWAIAFHPWTYLKEELEARNITQKQFAEIIWKTITEVNELINGKRNITTEWALFISTAFDTSIEVWLWLQETYNIYILQKKLKNKNEQKKILQIKKRAMNLAY